MSLLEKNLSSIRNKNPELADYLSRLKPNPSYSISDKGLLAKLQGGEVISFEEVGTFSNLREITTKRIFNFSEVIIILGFGMGDTLSKILKSADQSAYILMIESDPYFLTTLLASKDMTKELSDQRLTLSVAEEPITALMVNLEKEFGVFTRSNFQVIKNEDSIKLNPKYYAELEKTIERQKNMAKGNLIVMNKLSGLWQKNILLNIPFITKREGIKSLFEKLNGLPALIVSAGPSLDKNSVWIKKASPHMVVIAVDTVVKTLLKNSIMPDFVMSLDALFENWTHLEGIEKRDYTLVANPITYPKIIKEHSKNLMVSGYTEPLITWLEDIIGEFGTNLTGGSVATSAFDFARMMGCSPIILTGQDLAFSGGRTHAVGAKDEVLYNAVDATSNSDSRHEAVLETDSNDMVDGNLGHSLKSNEKMASWRHWFEIQIEIKEMECINATEGGAIIKGAKKATLREVLTKYCRGEEKETLGFRKKIKKDIKKNSLEIIDKRLLGLWQTAKEMKRLASYGLKSAKEAKNISADKDRLRETERKLKICSEYLERIMQEKEFLEINHWRLEKMLDSIQKVQSRVKSSDKQKQCYINSQAMHIFFIEMYETAKGFEKSLKLYHIEKKKRENEGIVVNVG